MILIMSFGKRLRGAATAAFSAVASLAVTVGCGSATESTTLAGARIRIVVTHALLGAQVADLVGPAAEVTVLIPNGADPHDWSPSAKDIERLLSADLVVRNGLGLEARLESALGQAESENVPVFTVADHVTVRSATAADSQSEVGQDPHLWMDPLTVKDFMAPLAAQLDELGVGVTAEVPRVQAELEALNADVAALLDKVPEDRRRLVTGHESLGYFAARYDYVIVGAVIPSFSSQAEASAGGLANLVEIVKREKVAAIFAEAGTSAATVDAIAGDVGVSVIELETHRLPSDGKYRTFMIDLATLVSTALR